MANRKISEFTPNSNPLGAYEIPMVISFDTDNYKVTFADASKALDANLLPVTGFGSPNLQGALNELLALTGGAIVLQGDWDADTNTPDITGATQTGYAWRVSVAGSTDLGGITDWKVNDWAVKVDTGWIKIDNQDIAAVWGNISGSLTNQTDLQLALDAKFNASGGQISGSTFIAGSLGVNTNTPSSAAEIRQISDFENGGLTVSDSGNLNPLKIWSTSSSANIYSGDGSSSLTLNTTGNVGVGIASPSAQLHVQSDSSGTVARVSSSSSDSALIDLQGNLSSRIFTGNEQGKFVVQTSGSGFSNKLLVTEGGTAALNATTFKEWTGIDSMALGENGAHIAYASSGSVFISMGAYFDGASFVRDGDGAVQVALLQRDGTTQFFSAPTGLDGELLTLTPTLSFGVSSFTYNGLDVLLDTGIPETDPDNFFATTFPETISTTSDYDASPVTAIDADQNITATGAFEVTATGLINTDATNRSGTVQLFIDDVAVRPSEVEIEPKDTDNYYSFTIRKTGTLNIGLRNFKLKYGRRGGGGSDAVTMVGGEITVRRLV